MSATIDVYQGFSLFASNDNSHAQLEAGVATDSPEPAAQPAIDMGLLRCLLKLGKSRERICSALLISGEEFDRISTAV